MFYINIRCSFFEYLFNIVRIVLEYLNFFILGAPKLYIGGQIIYAKRVICSSFFFKLTVKGGENIKKRKLLVNLIIILSVFICLASVTAQDSSDTNLTIDESSQTDISQITIDDNDYKTESVENSESSANEQNSLNNPHEDINYFYYLKLLLFRMAKISIFRVFFKLT